MLVGLLRFALLSESLINVGDPAMHLRRLSIELRIGWVLLRETVIKLQGILQDASTVVGHRHLQFDSTRRQLASFAFAGYRMSHPAGGESLKNLIERFERECEVHLRAAILVDRIFPFGSHDEKGGDASQQQRHTKRRYRGVACRPSPKLKWGSEGTRRDRTPLNEAAQVAGKIGSGGISTGGIPGHRSHHDCLEILRSIWPNLPRRRHLALHDFRQHQRAARIVKGWLERQQFVESQSKAIEVAASILRAADVFRSHEPQSPCDLFGMGSLLGLEHRGEAKVSDPDRALMIE